MAQKKKALVGNAADAEQVEKAKRTEEILDERDENDLRYLLNSEQGRRVLWKLLERCGLFQLSYISNNFGETAFLEGQRNIGLWLFSQLESASSEAVELMRREAQERQRGDRL